MSQFDMGDAVKNWGMPPGDDQCPRCADLRQELVLAGIDNRNLIEWNLRLRRALQRIAAPHEMLVRGENSTGVALGALGHTPYAPPPSPEPEP